MRAILVKESMIQSEKKMLTYLNAGDYPFARSANSVMSWSLFGAISANGLVLARGIPAIMAFVT
jgi:hypothetical protein